MKVASWNVNGIRATYKKGDLFKYLDGPDAPDLLGIQEIKAMPDQLTDELLYPENYYTYWNAAEKKGYSGVGIFSKVKPIKVQAGFDHPDFDHELQNTDGRVISAEFESFTFYNMYFPNGGKSPEHFEYKFQFYKYLFQHFEKLRKKGKSLVLVGDFNIAHSAIDLARAKSNEQSIGFTENERKELDKVIDMGYIDTFRTLHPDAQEYSWWHYISRARERNVGWRIDYVFITPDLKDKLASASILGQIMGSDHCPVQIELDCPEDKLLNNKVEHKVRGKEESPTLF